MRKLEYITVLRASAILAVLIVHVNLLTANGQHVNPYIQSGIYNGARGVQLEFDRKEADNQLSYQSLSDSAIIIISLYFIIYGRMGTGPVIGWVP